jgi:hypothetical protein
MADEEPTAPDRRASHPVKDIVLPLAVVLTLVGNALYVGSWGGRTGQRLDSIDQRLAEHGLALERAADQLATIKDRLRDLERDRAEDRKDFLVLEDYTRGRIDRLPYRVPPTARR